MNKTCIRMLVLRIKLRSLDRVPTSHHLSTKVKHKRLGQQQGDKTGDTERTCEERFSDQQNFRIASQQDTYQASDDAKQGNDSNKIELTMTHDADNTIGDGEKCSNTQRNHLRRRDVLFAKCIEQERNSCIDNDTHEKSTYIKASSSCLCRCCI